MAKATISEGIGWMKILKGRHAELASLRNANANRVIQDYNGRQTSTEPLHDAKKLDVRVTKLAREIRLLDAAIKHSNAVTLMDYTINDEVLGELEDTQTK